MDKKIEYWKWKSTIIDFNAISDELIDYDNYSKKKDWVFRYLGIPDNEIHEWYSGGFSSEYNSALRYAKQLGLVEDYVNYDDIIFNLKDQQKDFIDWLERKSKEVIRDAGYHQRICEEILEKYKEIIGSEE